MCKPFSCIVTKGKKVLICENSNIHSHESIVEEYNLKDVSLINRNWVRIEVYPKDYNYTLDVNTWKFQVDEEETLPEWFELEKDFYEDKCRKAAQKWKNNYIDKLGQYCIENIYGYKTWYKNGIEHRENGPAVECINGTKKWFINGKYHREDGPALEYADGRKEWYKEGLRHRLDGPAREYADGYKGYWLNNERHREDGPAIEYANGDKEYWLNGVEVKEKDVIKEQI